MVCLIAYYFLRERDLTSELLNFPFLNSNVPAGPSCGIYISQLLQIGRICTYEEFVKQHFMLISNALEKQGYR